MKCSLSFLTEKKIQKTDFFKALFISVYFIIYTDITVTSIEISREGVFHEIKQCHSKITEKEFRFLEKKLMKNLKYPKN